MSRPADERLHCTGWAAEATAHGRAAEGPPGGQLQVTCSLAEKLQGAGKKNHRRMANRMASYMASYKARAADETHQMASCNGRS